MEIRHATHPNDAKLYTTERLRKEFLMEHLFEQGQIHMVYSHHDRFIVGGIVPAEEKLVLTSADVLKTDFFLERRELAVINIGGPGIVEVDGEIYPLSKRDCLYVGRGKRNVSFLSEDQASPARFYLVSSLAHSAYPTQKLGIEQAEPQHLGSDSQSNKRTIYKYVHQDGIKSCQLMVGMTLLAPNNMWNTMPAHLHDRRMEAYLYFDLQDEAVVFHLMGEPDETRHLVVRNEQAVLSPGWSIHSGVGTSNYSFIWAMAGENYTFADMDLVAMKDLK